MKVNKLRIAIGILAVIAVGAAVWRLGTSGMTTYRWSQHFERGKALLDDGSFAEAALELEHALAAMREIGPDHADYDATRTLLADAYRAVGRYEDAQPLFMESLQRARLAHGSPSAELAQQLFELGKLQEIQGFRDAAIGSYRQAIAMWQEVVGNEHPDLIPTLTHLGRALAAREDHREASQYLEWAIGLERRALGSDHPDLADLELTYAATLRALDKDELAEQFEEHAERIRPKN